MTDWVTQIIRSTGYFGILFLMCAENVFPPIPSEVVMPLAGFLVSEQQLTLIGVILAGTAGSVIGALVLYFLGHKLGAEHLKNWCRRYGRWLAITTKDVDRAQSWFDRHGPWTVLFFRLIPGIRSLISIPAGISIMPMGSFLIYTTVGTAAWTALLASAGMYLRQQFDKTEQYVGPVSTGVIVLLVLWYLYRVIFPPREDQPAGRADDESCR